MVKKTIDKRVDYLIKDPSRIKPDFIANPNMDKLISVIMRLTMENSVLRDRIVRQEKLLVSKGVLSSDDFDAYEPDKETAQESQAESFDLIRAIINDLE
tara:strand:+ start:1148 stop:1444 length:297 start_codon:yes stop_codon:yes gene_type:complete